MSSNKYADMLNTKEWKTLRERIIRNHDNKCDVCFNSPLSYKDIVLHIHHKKYYKGRKPWEYDDNELMCLCSQCHEKIHDMDEKAIDMLYIGSPFRAREILVHMSSMDDNTIRSLASLLWFTQRAFGKKQYNVLQMLHRTLQTITMSVEVKDVC